MTRKVFLNSKDNQFVVIFFLTPYWGEHFVRGTRGGYLAVYFFFPVMVCTLNKIFFFLQSLVLLLNKPEKIIYLENNIV